MCGNPKAIKAYATIKDNTDSGQFRAIQKAGITALRNPRITENTIAKYSRRFNLLIDALQDLGFNAKKPQGSFYAYVKAPIGTSDGQSFATAAAFSDYLIRHALISTVPWDDAGAYIRFSVTFEAASPEAEIQVIREMHRRMKSLNLRFSVSR